MDEKELRRYSRIVVDGDEQAPSRAMLRAVGFTDEDFKRPQIGIASTWAMTTPCNMHIDKLAKEAALGADGAGGKGHRELNSSSAPTRWSSLKPRSPDARISFVAISSFR